jgi:hypothetical protein
MKDYKVVHFSEEFSMEDINEAMSFQDDILYYTRYIAEKKEFHIVNHSNGEFTLTPFISQLFNFYNQNEKLSELISDTKLKGNDSFTIIFNVNEDLISQIKNDLNSLLKK